MKFAGFPKFAFSLLAGVLAVGLAGCGSSNNMALTQGNWSVTATSTSGAVSHAVRHNLRGHKAITPNDSDVSFLVGGSLTQSGSNVAGTLHVIDSDCFDPSVGVAFTGTVDGQKVTLTSPAIQDQVITVTATGTSGSALTGTYTVTGDGCDAGDSGTLTANAVPSINGTWNGPLVNGNDDPNVVLSMALTQATTPSSDGTFALTGTLTYTGSTCSISGTVSTGSSFIAGTFLVINGVTTEADSSTGNFTYNQAFLNSPTSPTTMTGGYQETFGLCTDDFPNTTTFTKQ